MGERPDGPLRRGAHTLVKRDGYWVRLTRAEERAERDRERTTGRRPPRRPNRPTSPPSREPEN